MDIQGFDLGGQAKEVIFPGYIQRFISGGEISEEEKLLIGQELQEVVHKKEEVKESIDTLDPVKFDTNQVRIIEEYFKIMGDQNINIFLRSGEFDKVKKNYDQKYKAHFVVKALLWALYTKEPKESAEMVKAALESDQDAKTDDSENVLRYLMRRNSLEKIKVFIEAKPFENPKSLGGSLAREIPSSGLRKKMESFFAFYVTTKGEVISTNVTDKLQSLGQVIHPVEELIGQRDSGIISKQLQLRSSSFLPREELNPHDQAQREVLTSRQVIRTYSEGLMGQIRLFAYDGEKGEQIKTFQQGLMGEYEKGSKNKNAIKYGSEWVQKVKPLKYLEELRRNSAVTHEDMRLILLKTYADFLEKESKGMDEKKQDWVSVLFNLAFAFYSPYAFDDVLCQGLMSFDKFHQKSQQYKDFNESLGIKF